MTGFFLRGRAPAVVSGTGLVLVLAAFASLAMAANEAVLSEVSWEWVARTAVALAQALIFLLLARSDKQQQIRHSENVEFHNKILSTVQGDHDRGICLRGRLDKIEQLCLERHGPGRREEDRQQADMIGRLKERVQTLEQQITTLLKEATR